MYIRLDKYLSNQGVVARRKVLELLASGIVKVNNKVIREGGLKINPEVDQVFVEDKRINGEIAKVYIALNKPKGIVSTVSDEKSRKTVLSLVKVKERVYPVGRLDQDSSGLIILTNDGTLTQKLLHPKFHVPKTYRVVISGKLTESKKQKLEQGVSLKEGKTSPARVEIIEQNPQRAVMLITLHEGWNRQVRRMCGSLDLEVRDLQRVSFGPIELADLKLGSWRFLTPSEIEKLTKT